MISPEDVKRLQKLGNQLREHQWKKESAWASAMQWVGSFSWLAFFPFTFWAWKSGWHARCVLKLEAKLTRFRGRLGFDLED